MTLAHSACIHVWSIRVNLSGNAPACYNLAFETRNSPYCLHIIKIPNNLGLSWTLAALLSRS